MQTNKKYIKNDYLLWLICIGLALSLVSHVQAESLRDPTQIPNNLPTSAKAVYTASNASTGPALQSVMLSAEIKAAIISGKKINIGEQYKGSKLIELTESSATLRNKSGTKTILQMNAGIVKKNSAAAVRITKK